jgi:hypothetical protein
MLDPTPVSLMMAVSRVFGIGMPIVGPCDLRCPAALQLRFPTLRPISLSLTCMVLMLADVLLVLGGQRGHGLRGRYGLPAGRQELQRQITDRVPQELGTNRTGKDLGQERRHGVAEQALDLPPATVEAQVLGEGLEPAQLVAGQAAAGPMKGTRGGPRLRLDGPGGLGLAQLEEEAPVAAAPAEKPAASAAAGVPEVILALGDGGEQVPPLVPPTLSAGWSSRWGRSPRASQAVR